MQEIVLSIIVGVIVIVMGVLNTLGKIGTLHTYHRKRVAKENVKPFGRWIGAGTILMGVGITVKGIMELVNYFIPTAILLTLSTVLLIVTLVIGLGLILFGLFKYNKGIF